MALSNVGAIEAPFSIATPESLFGACFSFEPSSAIIPVGQQLTVHVSCTSMHFFEREMKIMVFYRGTNWSWTPLFISVDLGAICISLPWQSWRDIPHQRWSFCRASWAQGSGCCSGTNVHGLCARYRFWPSSLWFRPLEVRNNHKHVIGTFGFVKW